MRTTRYILSLLTAFTFLYGCDLLPRPRMGSPEIITMVVDTVNINKQYGKDGQTTIPSVYKQISEVIKNRLTKIGVEPNLIDITTQNNLLIVKIWDLQQLQISKDRIRNMLQVRGNLSFWQTYNSSTLSSFIELANKRLTEPDMDSITKYVDIAKDSGSSLHNQLNTRNERGPLFQILLEHFNDETGHISQTNDPEMGSAIEEDTAKIGMYLRDPRIKMLFPPNVKFLWNPFKKENKTEYNLIAIKISTRNGLAPLSGNIITDARVEFQHGNEHPIINIVMTPVAAITWARMTKEYIGRCIAMDIDDVVYSTPIVESEILGGRSSLTGNFDADEARDLAVILKIGPMVAPVKIIKDTTIVK